MWAAGEPALIMLALDTLEWYRAARQMQELPLSGAPMSLKYTSGLRTWRVSHATRLCKERGELRISYAPLISYSSIGVALFAASSSAISPYSSKAHISSELGSQSGGQGPLTLALKLPAWIQKGNAFFANRPQLPANIAAVCTCSVHLSFDCDF